MSAPPDPSTGDAHAALLHDLRTLVADEQAASRALVQRTWAKSMGEKLKTGLSQRFTRLEARDDESIWAYPSDYESRFREGDLLCLHHGDPAAAPLANECSLELEEANRWLVRLRCPAPAVLERANSGPCYADPDILDLKPYFDQTLDDIATRPQGSAIIQPLLAGTKPPNFFGQELTAGACAARAAGCNESQAHAVGAAFAADPLACIQGPPGTGKTRVLALAVKLMVDRGEQVLVTSHTHAAINNALNKINSQGVPVVKIGWKTQSRGLASAIPCHMNLAAWSERPLGAGYAVGATPFATFSGLHGWWPTTVVFDEASQVTLPLALMAMRVARRFVFIGDDKQLPPVVLSRSVLSDAPTSVFARLTSPRVDTTVMLDQTYRMNAVLAAWPSRTYYGGKLRAVGPNRDRSFPAPSSDARLGPVLGPDPGPVFIPTLDRSGRARNHRDAKLVADLCFAATASGLARADIGVVTPFRAQGRLVRTLLTRRFGHEAAREIVADTVERMQGQERELIILTLAAANRVFLAAVAEFFFQPERLNVSITRAMTKLIVIGPDHPLLPDPVNPVLAGWVRQYADMVAGCKRIEIS